MRPGGTDEEEDCDSCDQLQAMARSNSKMAAMLKKAKAAAKGEPISNGGRGEGEGEGEEVDGYGILEEEYVSPHRDSKGDWKMERPADFYQLGSSTWTLLHTMAAYYPSRPSAEKQAHTKQFLSTLPHVYPCRHCATDLAEEMERRPPRVGTRLEFAQWMCEVHNGVNVKLGKPEFDCTLVDQRWRHEG